MRLLVFSITFRPFIGGAEIALEEILKRVKGIEATIITARLDKTLPYKEVIGTMVIYRVGKGMKFDKYMYILNAYRLACRLHREKPFDLVQALMANYAGITALFFKKTFSKVPYLLTLQSGDSSFFIWIRTVWFLPLYKQVYRKADYIQAISNYLMERARWYGYTGKGSIVPNGVDFGHFSKEKSKEEIAAMRIELGIDPKDKIIITTSRLVYKNAIDQLILGFQEWIKKTEIPATLLIIGSGKKESKLKKLVEKLDIKKHVLFLGEKQHTALPLYLQSADLFVRPSRSEGMGNSFIEALAAGIPIIGTDVGGITDFLTDRETGLIVDRDNPYAIARAISTLVTNEELSTSIVKKGRERVKSSFEWDTVAIKMEAIYTNLKVV